MGIAKLKVFSEKTPKIYLLFVFSLGQFNPESIYIQAYILNWKSIPHIILFCSYHVKGIEYSRRGNKYLYESDHFQFREPQNLYFFH